MYNIYHISIDMLFKWMSRWELLKYWEIYLSWLEHFILYSSYTTSLWGSCTEKVIVLYCVAPLRVRRSSLTIGSIHYATSAWGENQYEGVATFSKWFYCSTSTLEIFSLQLCVCVFIPCLLVCLFYCYSLAALCISEIKLAKLLQLNTLIFYLTNNFQKYSFGYVQMYHIP